jgi:hypothetical protein
VDGAVDLLMLGAIVLQVLPLDMGIHVHSSYIYVSTKIVVASVSIFPYNLA